MAIVLPHALAERPTLHIARFVLHQYSFFSSTLTRNWIAIRWFQQLAADIGTPEDNLADLSYTGDADHPPCTVELQAAGFF
ncbi:MAG TPA: hypothetical protein VHS97_19060 [Isosphaeraceae bacterium]|nr:hypothetical protein [Isosphaeraceae bacterium]